MNIMTPRVEIAQSEQGPALLCPRARSGYRQASTPTTSRGLLLERPGNCRFPPLRRSAMTDRAAPWYQESTG